MVNCKEFPRCPALPPSYVCVEMATVTAGDTLYTISQEYDVPVPILMQANKILNPYNLKVGQRICIPGPAPENPVCVGVLHTVAPYDTLYRISQTYGTGLDAILNANPTLDPYNMQVGQKLCIPITPREAEAQTPEVSGLTETIRETIPERNAGSTGGSATGTTAGGAAGATTGGTGGATTGGASGATAGNTTESAAGSSMGTATGSPVGTLTEQVTEITEAVQEKANHTPPESYIYEVRENDTLDAILGMLRISLESLLQSNPQLSLNQILTPGAQLFLPR